MALLEIDNLTINYRMGSKNFSVVKNFSFSIEKGTSLGLIGESGSGKTTVGMSVLRLLPENAMIQNGKILFRGEDILTMAEKNIRALRGKKISMIFQAAMNSLNPVHRIGDQIFEALQVHDNNLSKKRGREKVAQLFQDVGLPLSRISDFPHQYSGGMKQRAVIAMALACSPDILIADEPTTALDMTVQKQILEKLKELQKKHNIAIMLISHDIGVISEICHEIAVIVKGEMIEYGTRDEILNSPLHPFTRKMIASHITLNGKNRLPDFKKENSGLTGIAPLETGCCCSTNCSLVRNLCRTTKPLWKNISETHRVRCHFWDEPDIMVW